MEINHCNSPVEELDHDLFREKQVRVFLKRDDMIHPFISGNKWRKLKYLLKDAGQQGKKRLVTFGGAYSNHLLATAAAGARSGFDTSGFVRGEEVLPLNDTLFLCRQFGMNLVYVSRERYAHDKAGLFDEYFKGDPLAYVIDEGGTGSLAMRGCAELLDELDETFDHIVLACGTGTTAAGLLEGITERNLPTRVEGIAVLKNAGFLEQDIWSLAGMPLLSPDTGSKSPVTDPAGYRLTLHLDFHHGGYAKTSPGLTGFMRDFHQGTGILLDPVYTGKMVYALFELIRNGCFVPGSKVLAIHTGGLFGLLGMKERLD